MASFAENFLAGAQVVGAGMDRSLRAQQLRLQEAQQRMQERQLQQQASLIMEQAAKYKADRVQQEMDNDMKKAAGENFPLFLAEELAKPNQTQEQAQESAFKRATMPLAIANPKLYIEMHDAKRNVFEPTITPLKDAAGNPVDVLRTGPNQFRQVRTAATTATSSTTAMKDIDRANEMLKQAGQLEASGDKSGAEALRADALLLKQSHAKSGMSLEVLPDGSVRFSEGGMPKIPMGVTTEFTKRLSATEKALDTLGDVKETLRPQDVGLKGVLGELALDRILPQFGVNSADAKRMDNRTKIATLRETLMRQISADTRFSNLDRQAIEKFLPSSGILESFEHTQQAVDTLTRILAKRALIDAKAASLPPPALAIQSLNDIGIQEAVEAGLLTMEQGAEEFFRRHPELKQ